MADYFDKIRPVLEALQIGEAVIYPISRMKSVRTQASELGAIHNRQYTTKTDREARTITVKRTMFIKDLAAQIVRLLKEDSNDPEFISQRKAFELFGRANVERWKRLGLVHAYKRPGKLDYKTADLRFLQRCPQDYLKVHFLL